jgi:hypothetical protein
MAGRVSLSVPQGPHGHIKLTLRDDGVVVIQFKEL